MKEIFKYTFLSIAEWKKFLILILIFSIFTLLESLPLISVVTYIFEKILYLSIGAFLIYLIKNSQTAENFFENLQKNSISTFLFHFLPTAAGIIFGLLLIGFFWFLFFIIILEFTGSMFIFANPNNFLQSVAATTFITKILIGFYLVYLTFYSYVFLGKFGESLNKETFKEAFISIIYSLFDFKFWIKTFNFKYFLIYLVWSIIVFTIYLIMIFIYLFEIFPAIHLNPNISLIIIPLFSAISVILAYFTFFSAYFSYKSTTD